MLRPVFFQKYFSVGTALEELWRITFGRVSKRFRKLIYQMGGGRNGIEKVLGIAYAVAIQ